MSKTLELLEEARFCNDRREQASVLAQVLIRDPKATQVLHRNSDIEIRVGGAHKPVRCPRKLVLEAVRATDPEGKESKPALKLLGVRSKGDRPTNRRSTKHRARNGS
ncbi:MAG: hypothetical protein BWY19_00159 [bacterium ADurb.Bin212]|nr:MAG: hypothetical protein BWY19_00159 [bacterium ADurb.Bin212]